MTTPKTRYQAYGSITILARPSLLHTSTANLAAVFFILLFRSKKQRPVSFSEQFWYWQRSKLLFRKLLVLRDCSWFVQVSRGTCRNNKGKKVKLSLSTPLRQIEAVKVQLHSFLTSALGGGEWSTRPGLFTPEKKKFEFSLNRRPVGPRVGMDASARRKICCLYRHSNPRPFSP